MRASLAQTEFVVTPGEPFTLGVEVANNGEVIDSVSAAVTGLEGARVATTPSELRLFPGSVGTLKLSVGLPKAFPAGRHRARVEVSSAVGQADRVACDIVVEVLALPKASVSLAPLTRRARRKGSFEVLCHNGGNVALQVQLSASDPERALWFSCVPDKLAVSAGRSARATLYVRAPRKIFGAERARPVVVTAKATVRPGRPPWGPVPGARPRGPELALAVPRPEALAPVEAQATYVQRPSVPSGVATAAVLTAIVALWASIFVLGLRLVLAEQPLAKSAPLSFFAQAPAATTSVAGPGRAVLASLPPKDFAPLGVAGSITGKVTSPGLVGGVGGVVVQAWQLGPGGGPPASAATLSDGTYQIAGLFPGRYKLSFSAPGLETVWYPGASTERTAKSVEVGAASTTAGVDVMVRGRPASIRGRVLTGESPSPAVSVSAVAVAAYPPASRSPGKAYGTWLARRSARAAADGSYTFPGLPSPATYTLTFAAPGFVPVREQVQVPAGQVVVANVVQLQGKPGEIAGMVSNAGKALGGVRVSAGANGSSFVSETPTTGAVGHFSLLGLPTPATYLLTFQKAGYGPVTTVVDLGPGQAVSDLRVAMAGGAGSIAGLVAGPGGKPLGGVEVTASGLAKPVSTETLTAGQVGTYKLSGLPTPGTYAVTFSLPGYTSETVGVNLVSGGSAQHVDVTLPLSTGQLSGKVEDAGTAKGLAGVAVVITNGSRRLRTFTTSSPPGGYRLAQLPAGTYTVTYLLRGYTPETALVSVRAGQEVAQSVALRKQAT